jgi:hypothetical protein
MESIESRLAYETRRPADPTDGKKAAPWEDFDDSLDDSLRLSTGQRRAWVLQTLHENYVRAFANAPGFGVVRMIGPDLRDIQRANPIRTAPPFSLPEPPDPSDAPSLSVGDLTLDPADSALATSGLSRNDLRLFHHESVYDFANPVGFGFARDRGHVAGFVSHRFTRYPPKPGKEPDAKHWRVESLDLVSLLKHAEPVAYVSKRLPRMDELRDAPTRPLDEFEVEGLTKLKAGEELYRAESGRRVRMVGAIRARDECLKCHSVDKGELLGAFSYDLRRDLPLHATKDPP